MSESHLPDIHDFMPLPEGRMEMPDSADPFLVSFPRSGSNWLGAMISHCLAEGIDVEARKEIYEAAYGQEYDPGAELPGKMMLCPNIYIWDRLPKYKRPPVSPGHLVFRSHTWKSLRLEGPSIYLFRQAEDSLVSFYHFGVRTGDIDPEKLGMKAYAMGNLPWWKCHLLEAKRRHEEGVENLKFVPYEELCRDTPTWLEGIMKHLGISVNSDFLESTVHAASLETMMTRVLKNPWHLAGRPGQGESLLDPETLEVVRADSREVYEHLWEIAQTQQERLRG